MLKKIIISVTLCAILSGSAAVASDSWYVIDNYAGTIGKSPVHVSLQRYSFGGETNIKGSYYYDKYRSPIPLYGKITPEAIILCEVKTNQEYDDYLTEGKKYDLNMCPLKLTPSGDVLQGTWQNTKRTLDVVLNKTASMDKTVISDNPAKTIEIPFWGQTAAHSFIGVYEMKDDGLSVNKVMALNKSSGKVDQVIDPQLHQCDFGFYMTAIYQNIERLSNPSQIALNCYSKTDFSVVYGLNQDKHTYSSVD
ncbi:hypothetical protein GE278_22640 (plasmid) [Enterobacteriaceae bacterium Kacie_13]|nr:hypothetical protein GE278_22640 [Enterobacteriaceae bacterium Kacie_13]